MRPPIVAERVLEEMEEDTASVKDDAQEEEKVPNQSILKSPKIRDKLYRKKFDFLYYRTCFRLMAEFYKYMFTSFVKTKKVSRNLPKLMTTFS